MDGDEKAVLCPIFFAILVCPVRPFTQRNIFFNFRNKDMIFNSKFVKPFGNPSNNVTIKLPFIENITIVKCQAVLSWG